MCDGGLGLRSCLVQGLLELCFQIIDGLTFLASTQPLCCGLLLTLLRSLLGLLGVLLGLLGSLLCLLLGFLCLFFELRGLVLAPRCLLHRFLYLGFRLCNPLAHFLRRQGHIFHSELRCFPGRISLCLLLPPVLPRLPLGLRPRLALLALGLA